MRWTRAFAFIGGVVLWALGATSPALARGPLVLRPTEKLVVLAAEDRAPPARRQAGGRLAIPLRVPDAARLGRAKARAAAGLGGNQRPRRERSRAPRSSAAPELAPLAAVFDGLNEPGLVAAGFTPPDSTGAVGPSHYVEMVNSEIGVFGRADLSLAASTDLNTFTGAPASDTVFDPQVQWDPVADRWLYVADDVEAPGSNFLAFGWSKTSNPTPLGSGGWCRFFISTGDEFHDYPKLGHNDGHMIVGANVFDDSGGPTQDDFLGAAAWAIPKPAATSTGCTPPSAFLFGPLASADGDDVFTPVPVNTFQASANGYLVAADFFTGDAEIMAWHMTAAPTLVSDGNIPVAAFGLPAPVPQPGPSSGTLDSLDSRLTQAVARTDPDAGQLAVWTQHTVDGPGGRSVVRWYELLPGLCGGVACPVAARRQQGTIADPDHFVFNGAIAPASNGRSAAVNYNLGSSTLLAALRARSRQGIDPLGGMSGEVTLGTSAAADQDFTCGPPGSCRWGDYAGASPDPVNPALVWGSNQLNGPPAGALSDDPHWVTRNFALKADTVPPQTTILSGPASGSLTNDRTPTFTFASNEPGSSFQCALDAPFGGCSGPAASHTPAPLPDGGHAFAVRAIDSSANVDASPEPRMFTVDATAPETTITSGPPGRVSTTRRRVTARFRVASNEKDGGFECRLDRKPWEACDSPSRARVRARSEPRKHVFKVRATDLAENTDSTPAKLRWRVVRVA